MIYRNCIVLAAAAGGLYAWLPLAARADLNISTLHTPVTIDFDNVVANINPGPYTGQGFEPVPESGELDSDSWAITGNGGAADDDILDFGEGGDEGDESNGDWELGSSQETPGFFTPGVFAVDRDEGAGVNQALGLAPGDNHFTPGTVTLRVLNNTGATVNSWSIMYDALEFNRTNDRQSLVLEYSLNNSTWSATSLSFLSTETDSGGFFDDDDWAATAQSTTINATVANSSNLYLRWTTNESGLASGTDAVGLDNIKITAIPEPSALLFGGLICSVLGLNYASRRIIRTLKKTSV